VEVEASDGEVAVLDLRLLRRSHGSPQVMCNNTVKRRTDLSVLRTIQACTECTSLPRPVRRAKRVGWVTSNASFFLAMQENYMSRRGVVLFYFGENDLILLVIDKMNILAN
jgi:hypothetical protein